MVLNDRRTTIREVADDGGILIGSCREIFSNVLGTKRVAAIFVPKFLILYKISGVVVAQESLNEVNDDAESRKCYNR